MYIYAGHLDQLEALVRADPEGVDPSRDQPHRHPLLGQHTLHPLRKRLLRSTLGGTFLLSLGQLWRGFGKQRRADRVEHRHVDGPCPLCGLAVQAGVDARHGGGAGGAHAHLI